MGINVKDYLFSIFLIEHKNYGTFKSRNVYIDINQCLSVQICKTEDRNRLKYYKSINNF